MGECERVQYLPYCLEELAPELSDEVRARTDQLLETVGRLRMVGIATRQHLEESGRTSPEAALWISPVPMSLTMPRIQAQLERYGKIHSVRRRAHPVGVGADALVQFTQPAHATAALNAIIDFQVLGTGVEAKRYCELM